jgi:hypothetical protein
MLPGMFSSFLQNGLYMVNLDWNLSCSKRWLLISSGSVMMVVVMWIPLDVMVMMDARLR